MPVNKSSLGRAVGRKPRRPNALRPKPERPVSRRRIGTENSKTRTALLNATEQLMLEDGYAAVTSRRLASRAGLKPQLVHYYFRTMEDLFLAVFHRHAERNLERLAEIPASSHPFRALWQLSVDPEDARLIMEFTVLANHQKAIRSEIARFGERYRSLQIDVLSRIFSDYGLNREQYSPTSMALIVTALSRYLVMEETLGMAGGHAETRALVERYLRRIEGGRKLRKGKTVARTART